MWGVVNNSKYFYFSFDDHIVIHQPIALPQVPLALHQTIIQQQPRQYIHIKTEPNITAAASNIPAQLNSTNKSNAKTITSSAISSSTCKSKSFSAEKNVVSKLSNQTIVTNIQKEVDSAPDDQCDSNSNSSSISPNSITGNVLLILPKNRTNIKYGVVGTILNQINSIVMFII